MPGRPKPWLLLHVCCGPCATEPIRALAQGYRVTLFFSNSNVAPAAEYARRRDAAREVAARTGLELVEDTYDHAAWREAVRGLEDEPERGRRCAACFEFNLGRAARWAAAHGCDAFTTTLTISPHKDAAAIFRIGAGLGPFLPLDFKAGDGFRRSVELSRAWGLYRQSTCGCEFSGRGAGRAPGRP